MMDTCEDAYLQTGSHSISCHVDLLHCHALGHGVCYSCHIVAIPALDKYIMSEIFIILSIYKYAVHGSLQSVAMDEAAKVFDMKIRQCLLPAHHRLRVLRRGPRCHCIFSICVCASCHILYYKLMVEENICKDVVHVIMGRCVCHHVAPCFSFLFSSKYFYDIIQQEEIFYGTCIMERVSMAVWVGV